jgi:hypothetical protein
LTRLLPRLLLLVAIVVASSTVAAQTKGADGNANIIRWAKGKIEYRVLSTGERNGEEDWYLTVHPDGSRTMRAVNRLDNVDFHRSVILRVEENFRPLEVMATYWIRGAWAGSGLFTIDDNVLEAVANTPNGRLTQRLAVPKNFSVIPHPLSTNSWQTWHYDKARGGDQPTTVYDMDALADRSGSLLGRLSTQNVRFIGSETLTTPAGTFLTDHFRIGDGVELYVTGPDALMVKFVWTAADREYILIALESSD